MPIDSRITINESEAKDWRIHQLENALAEILVEIRQDLDNGHSVAPRVLKAWTNANLILNKEKR
jgi:hypothetical protein